MADHVDHAASMKAATLDLKAQLRYLLHEWRMMLGPRSLIPDAVSGIAVSLVAVPLSLAIAAASGVPPEVGLITAIVGGITVAFLGGCRLQISGPAAAMTFLVYEIVTKFGASNPSDPTAGVKALVAATLIAGALQVVSGYFRLGRFIEFIPRPVIAGFLTGIGITILSTQAPIVLGYDVDHGEEGGAIGFLYRTLKKLPETNFSSLLIGAVVVALMISVPKLSRRLPTPLIAVGIGSLIPWFLGWSQPDGQSQVALLGALPTKFPTPTLPSFPLNRFNELVMAAVTIYFLATLESLLSASLVDSMAKQGRSDHDQELVGQGAGNVASALFGGLPVTGVIARSATNVQSGARTRLSAIIHALLILAMMFVLAPLVAYIPRAALAGVLIAVAVRMVEIHMLKTLWKGSKPEALVYMVTAGAILLTDLIVGVPIGMVAAFIYFVAEMSRIDVAQARLVESNGDYDEANEVEETFVDDCPVVQVLKVGGPMFFGSIFNLRNAVNQMTGIKYLIIRMESVPFMDVTGGEQLEEIAALLKRKGIELILVGLQPQVRQKLRGLTETDGSVLRDCPVYINLLDAYLHTKASMRDESQLCHRCRKQGECMGLKLSMGQFATMYQTAVPSVRALIASGSSGAFQVEDRPAPTAESKRHSEAKSRGVEAEAKTEAGHEPHVTVGRPGKDASWTPRSRRPVIHPTAFVDHDADVTGQVTIGERVYIAPRVSIRTDEGTPFHIDNDANIQEGVTIRALRDKVVMVQGRPYAVFIGQRVACTHQSLIHGPCYIGDECLIGFKAAVHDSVLGEGCVLGIGATVVGVTLKPRRYVAHGQVIDTQDKADALPEIDEKWSKFRAEVVEANRELAEAHANRMRRKTLGDNDFGKETDGSSASSSATLPASRPAISAEETPIA